MYMSYCRFEGTQQELQACFSAVEEHVNGEAEYAISDREICCFKKMIEEVAEFLYDNDLLDEYGEVNATALDDICESMAKGGED